MTELRVMLNRVLGSERTPNIEAPNMEVDPTASNAIFASASQFSRSVNPRSIPLSLPKYRVNSIAHARSGLSAVFSTLVLLVGGLGILSFHTNQVLLFSWTVFGEFAVQPRGQSLGYMASWGFVFSALASLTLYTGRELLNLFFLILLLLIAVIDLSLRAIIPKGYWTWLFSTVVPMSGPSNVTGMSLNGSIVLLLSGCAIVLLRSRSLTKRDLHLASGLSFSILALGCITFLGNLADLGIPWFRQLSHMSLPGSVGTLAMALSLLSSSGMMSAAAYATESRPLRLLVLYSVASIFLVAFFSAAFGIAPLYDFLMSREHSRVEESLRQKSAYIDQAVSEIRQSALAISSDRVANESGVEAHITGRSKTSVKSAVTTRFEVDRKRYPDLLGICRAGSSRECEVQVGESMGEAPPPERALSRSDVAVGLPFSSDSGPRLMVSVPIWGPNLERVGTDFLWFEAERIVNALADTPFPPNEGKLSLVASGAEMLSASSTVRSLPVAGGSWRIVAEINASPFENRLRALLREIFVGVLGLIFLGCVIAYVLLRSLTGQIERLQRVLRTRTGRLRKELEVRLETEHELANYRNNLEEMLLERSEQLKRSHEQLRETERLAALGSLASGIAHEINNPVGAIVLVAENGLEAAKAAKDKVKAALILSDACERIVCHARRCGGIVKGVLQFARNEQQERVKGDLNTVVRNVLRLFHETQGSNKATFELDLEAGIPPAFINVLEIEQALFNLFKNAVEACAEHRRPTVPLVKIKTWTEETEACLSVTDNGAGISQDDLKHIFEPFYSTKKRSGGSGLGLSVVHGIFRSHGGKIQVRSVVGTGTTMEVRLPVFGESQISPVNRRVAG